MLLCIFTLYNYFNSLWHDILRVSTICLRVPIFLSYLIRDKLKEQNLTFFNTYAVPVLNTEIVENFTILESLVEI